MCKIKETSTAFLCKNSVSSTGLYSSTELHVCDAKVIMSRLEVLLMVESRYSVSVEGGFEFQRYCINIQHPRSLG